MLQETRQYFRIRKAEFVGIKLEYVIEGKKPFLDLKGCVTLKEFLNANKII